MHQESLSRTKIRLVSLVSVIAGFLYAFLIYILSNYFAEVIGEKNVGIMYFLGYGGLLISLFYLQPLVRRIGKARALYLSLGLTILACAFLTRIDQSFLALALLLAFIVASSTAWVLLDILLESFSQDQMSGRIRGLYLTLVNLSLIPAPFLSAATLEKFGYNGVFFVLLLGYIAIFLLSLFAFRNDNAVALQRILIRETIRKMISEANLFRIYFISFAMDFFYAIMIVYTPLHLLSLGFSWYDIGIAFTVMLLPFVLLQYPLGMLADTKMGEKELIIGCLSIAVLATLAVGLFHGNSLVIWSSLLFLTRVGIAGIEVLRDSYFYKQIDGNDLDVIAFFRTSLPLANIFGALSSAILLFFFSLQATFFLVVFVLLAAIIVSLFLDDTKGESERLDIGTKGA
ncbi:MAG: MFS transporter, partial [Patescibacteria group bacterium]